MRVKGAVVCVLLVSFAVWCVVLEWCPSACSVAASQQPGTGGGVRGPAVHTSRSGGRGKGARVPIDQVEKERKQKDEQQMQQQNKGNLKVEVGHDENRKMALNIEERRAKRKEREEHKRRIEAEGAKAADEIRVDEAMKKKKGSAKNRSPEERAKLEALKERAKKAAMETRGMKAAEARMHFEERVPELKMKKLHRTKHTMEDPTEEDLKNLDAAMESAGEANGDDKGGDVLLKVSGNSVGIYEHDTFIEEMVLRNLNMYAVYSHFQFTTKTDRFHNEDIQSSEIFPRVLRDLILKYGIAEMSLSFTQGMWNYERWGFPISGSPTGVELHVWFFDEDFNGNVVDVDYNWKMVVHTLSGMFCATLNVLDESMTVSPKYWNEPNSPFFVDQKKTPWKYRYGILPRENSCTENLTPWKKLLPCRGKGLVRLLNPLKVYDSLFNSMAIKTSFVCSEPSCKEPSLQLIQTLSMVQRIEVSKIWKQPFSIASTKNVLSWDFEKIFGQTLGAHCPVASSSEIFVDVTSELEQNMTPVPERYVAAAKFCGAREEVSEGEVFPLSKTKNDDAKIRAAQRDSLLHRGGVTFSGNRQFGVYDVRNTTSFNLMYNETKPDSEYDSMFNRRYRTNVEGGKAVVFARKALIGYGQEQGAIAIRIFNDHKSSVEALLFDTLPWYFRMYMHTMRQKITYASGKVETKDMDSCIFTPSMDRARSSSLECFLDLPAQSIVTVEYDFKKLFLRYTEYPPDANHGFHVGSAAILLTLPSTVASTSGLNWSPNNAKTLFNKDTAMTRIVGSNLGLGTPKKRGTGYVNVVIYTNSLLVRSPIPDFSMPYNVITLTCTVLALIFGNVFNNITRSFAAFPVKCKDGSDVRRKRMKIFGLMIIATVLTAIYLVENEIVDVDELKSELKKIF
eukprot:Nk52_evm2s330 gene=Nk52_evmTU2s330